MANCPSCGVQIPAASTRCPECGGMLPRRSIHYQGWHAIRSRLAVVRLLATLLEVSTAAAFLAAFVVLALAFLDSPMTAILWMLPVIVATVLSLLAAQVGLLLADSVEVSEVTERLLNKLDRKTDEA